MLKLDRKDRGSTVLRLPMSHFTHILHCCCVIYGDLYSLRQEKSVEIMAETERETLWTENACRKCTILCRLLLYFVVDAAIFSSHELYLLEFDREVNWCLVMALIDIRKALKIFCLPRRTVIQSQF